jgi:Ca2+-binding EF-hand superfamily protein
MFMEKVGKPMDDAELKVFLRRVDQDGDGRISYSEYLDVFYSSDSELVLEEFESYKAKSRGTSPKRQEKEKDEEYLGYLRKAYTSPKRKTDMLKKSADTFQSPAKKLSFEDDYRYRTPTKKSSAVKMTDDYSSVTKMSPPQKMSGSKTKQSPLKAKDEQEFVRVLKDIIEYNRSIESIKNDLALRKDFNLFNAFNVFDTSRKGYITSKELEAGLNTFEIYPSKDELFLLMKRFDPNLDGIVK